MQHSDPSQSGTPEGPLQQIEWLVDALTREPDAWALFLDIDGTLVDIAPSPDAIVVPPDLPGHLVALSRRLNGALALVTGRALPYADKLFQPYELPVAGLHGAERRLVDGSVDAVTATSAFEEVKAALAAAAGQWPGVLVEDKGAAVAAHYRQAPEWRDEVEKAMEFYLLQAGSDFTLQRGKMVFEIRPARANKGSAVQSYLEEAPFRGRRPIAIGDDVTDEDMFRIVNRMGGHSIRIADAPGNTEARGIIASAEDLRQALARAATAGDGSEFPSSTSLPSSLKGRTA